MFFNILDATCGGVTIPQPLADVIHTVYTVVKIAIPVILIFMGILDLGRAVISQKEDEIKKNQGIFVKRLIAAALVFFVFAIVQLLVGVVAGDDKTSISNCMDCMLNGSNCN